MAGQQSTTPTSAPPEDTAMSDTEDLQRVEMSEPESPEVLHGEGTAMPAGAEGGTPPDDFDPRILENIKVSMRELAQVTLLWQEFSGPPPPTNFPTFEPEQRRICGLMALGQLEIPHTAPPRFNTREDAEIWLAAKPPLVLTLPRLETACHASVMGAALADVTQMLAEVKFISIGYNPATFDIECASHYRRFTAKIAKEHLMRTILARVQPPVCQELAKVRQQVINKLRSIPLSDYHARKAAHAAAMDQAQDQLRVTLPAASRDLVARFMADLSDPTSALVRCLPDCGLWPGATSIPFFVRVYMDAVWGSSVAMVRGMVQHLITRMARKALDDIFDAPEVSRSAPRPAREEAVDARGGPVVKVEDAEDEAEGGRAGKAKDEAKGEAKENDEPKSKDKAKGERKPQAKTDAPPPPCRFANTAVANNRSRRARPVINDEKTTGN